MLAPPTVLLLPVRLVDFGKSTPAALIDYSYTDQRRRVRGARLVHRTVYYVGIDGILPHNEQ
jgi:hypothetical protein